MAEFSRTIEDVNKSLSKKEPVHLRYHYVSKDASDFMSKALSLFLEKIGKGHMEEELTYLVREFVTNANKSNLKRVHFQTLSLNIDDPKQYEQGMTSFFDDYHKNLQNYSQQFDRYGFYTDVTYATRNGAAVLTIKNSNCPTIQEYSKVGNLIEKSKSIRDAAEAFMTVGDTSEGSGIGMISAILMLRSLGLSEKNYHFQSDVTRKETIVTVEVPLNTVTDKQAESISKVIAVEIESLPVFPEKITQIQKMLSDENIAFSRVANVVQSDPALTAELLKLVNSAQYMLPQKVSNITNAVSLIGIKGLKNLLYSYQSQKIFEKQYGRMDKIWEHAFRTASYCFHLAGDFGMSAIRDDAYVGGILHDMGKIIVIHAHPGLLEKIVSHCEDKSVSPKIMEGIALGTSHAKIGAEIAKKWNFPEVIVNAIGFHHDPLLAPDEYQDIASLIYLANELTNVKSGSSSYASIEPLVLSKFKIGGEKEFMAIEKRMDAFYQQQKQKVEDDIKGR